MSASLGDDANAGTKAAPVRTLQKAVDLAREHTHSIYACAEEFNEAVVLPTGIKLFGGLDCKRAFVFPGDLRRTTIEGPFDAVTVTALGGEWTTRLQNVTIRARNATQEGGSSIAVMALHGARFELLNSDVHAGKGVPGALGENGSPLWMNAEDGSHGAEGIEACKAEFDNGGKPSVHVCGDQLSVGGRGGSGDLSNDAHAGNDGLPYLSMSGSGLGGQGQTAASACTNGADGEDGMPGDNGLGAMGKGRLSASGYLGLHGQDGAGGLPGQGGGGGGGAQSAGMCMSGASFGVGAGGGAGGSGGCGGRGGKGGGFGGASIGIASVFATITLDSVDIFTGRGGDGGEGGWPQFGGFGGMGGKGGAAADGAGGACAGGKGGRGGTGGKGGGGMGGPSVGIAFVGNPPHLHNTIVVPGEGGYGGPAATAEGEGQPGDAAELLELEGAP
ncbi:MAG: DUF1565 domain-containing protein [Polyangiaceae bacterium]|nr:DUF1565 domain-containing protein [Polyangiaceae bacterium]